MGICRNSQGTLDTDKLFTGQRLDDTGLYYYNARYYDATIGRFISADTIVPNYTNPQTLNRYSYCLNNPLKYVDPSGHDGTQYPVYDANGNPIPGAWQSGPGAAPGSVLVLNSDGSYGGYVNLGSAAEGVLYIQLAAGMSNPYNPSGGWHWNEASIYYENGGTSWFSFMGTHNRKYDVWMKVLKREVYAEGGGRFTAFEVEGTWCAYQMWDMGASVDFNENVAFSLNLDFASIDFYIGDDAGVEFSAGWSMEFNWNQQRFGFWFLTIDLPDRNTPEFSLEQAADNYMLHSGSGIQNAMTYTYTSYW